MPGYGGKIQSYDASQTICDESEENCGDYTTVSMMVFWESFESWKSIPPSDLEATNAAFIEMFGMDIIPQEAPGDNGWRIN